MNTSQINITQHRPALGLILLIYFNLLVGCEGLVRSSIPVSIEVDHGTLRLETNAKTVRDLLAEAGITLGELDRVNPDLNFLVRPQMTVRVIRVKEEIETETIPLAFERRIMVNEALPPGEQRLAQLGVNGQEEIVTKITFENGVEVNRVQISKTTIQEPSEEILIVGAERQATAIPIPGLIAYLSGGNAWLMKDNSATRRPITTVGDLDGRVFDLSPDGSKLLYTRLVTDVVDAPLNELWMIDTRLVGEEPISLPIKGVLYAAWSPRLTETVIAYSTADRVPSQPGWRAKNDLWLWDMDQPLSKAVEIVPANTNGLYPWWGTTYAWSPDGDYFAYANANQVGVIDVISQTITPVVEFTPYQTNSDWVWAPTISWSPNSKFIATVIHGPPLQSENPAASPVFDLWLLSREGTLKAKVWAQAGMWSNPVWHQEGIAFGQATKPLSSVDSRYKLVNMDWDGSNSQILFPLGPEPGVSLPEIVWKPQNTQAEGDLFVFVKQNNLFLAKRDGTPPLPLTSDSQSHRPEWVIPSNSASLTIRPHRITPPVTRTHSITSTIIMTSTAPITP